MSGPCGHFDFGEDTPWIGKLGFGIPALKYAELGFSVLPLVRGGKKPHRMLPETGGVHHASRDGRQIQDWWSRDPAANIGVACGRRSRLAVIDLDVKRENGTISFTDFLNTYRLGMPHAAIARTPSGGYHLWLRVPEGPVPDRPGILPGVDVKGDGGYVVAAPSMILTTPMARPGEHAAAEPYPVPYVWSGCPCTAPEAPEWLAHWLATAPATGSSGGQAGEQAPGEAPDLASLQRTGILPGQRNSVLYRLACQRYRVHGTTTLGAQRVLAELRPVWLASQHGDFAWSEVLVIAESARRFIEAQEQKERTAYQRYSRWMPR
jgi:hypothetical protein